MNACKCGAPLEREHRVTVGADRTLFADGAELARWPATAHSYLFCDTCADQACELLGELLEALHEPVAVFLIHARGAQVQA